LRAATDSGLQKLEQGARALGDAVCTQLPAKLKIAAECGGEDGQVEQVEQAKAEPPPAAPITPDSSAPQPPLEADQTPSEQDALLGAGPAAPATSVPVVMAPVHVHAGGAVHVRAHRARRTRPTIHRLSPHTIAVQTHNAPPHAPSTHAASVHAGALHAALAHAHVAPPHQPTRTPPSPQATPVVTHPAPTPAPETAHTTPVVAPPQASPGGETVAETAVAIPHPELAAPEPRVAAAPPSAAPSDVQDAPAVAPDTEPAPEKHDLNQAPTF
jgi:hypothetical protein